MAFETTWVSVELVNRLLGRREPLDKLVKQLMKEHHPSRRRKLSPEQRAVGELMVAALREYSESHWCAGWCSGMEHAFWDEVTLRKEDAYERACVRLRKLAGQPGWRRPRQRSLFAEGLRLLVARFGIWAYYDDNTRETILPLSEWLTRHAAYIQQEIEQRMSYEKVWELAHFDIGRRKPRRVPPLPAMKLPPLKPLHR